MRKALMVVALLVPTLALAESVRWYHPTQRQDGSPASYTDVQYYKVLRNGSQIAQVTPAPGDSQTMDIVRQVGTNLIKIAPYDNLNRAGTVSNEILLAANTPTPVPTATPTNTPPALLGAPVLSQE